MNSIKSNILTKSFWLSVKASISRVIFGYIIALFLGVVIGVLLGWNRTLDETLGAVFLGIQSIPTVGWVPLGILFFGPNEKAVLFVIIIGAVGVIALNVDGGVKQIPGSYITTSRAFNYNGLSLVKNVILPASIPAIITGMRLGWAWAWRGLVSAELLISGIGLGQILMRAKNASNIDEVISIMIFIAMIGSLTDNLIFRRMERKVRERWGMAVY